MILWMRSHSVVTVYQKYGNDDATINDPGD